MLIHRVRVGGGGRKEKEREREGRSGVGGEERGVEREGGRSRGGGGGPGEGRGGGGRTNLFSAMFPWDLTAFIRTAYYSTVSLIRDSLGCVYSWLLGGMLQWAWVFF